jgi:hypothetical protein
VTAPPRNTIATSYITECGKEFDLTNAEQLLFLKFIVAGKESAEELLRGE